MSDPRRLNPRRALATSSLAEELGRADLSKTFAAVKFHMENKGNGRLAEKVHARFHDDLNDVLESRDTRRAFEAIVHGPDFIDEEMESATDAILATIPGDRCEYCPDKV